MLLMRFPSASPSLRPVKRSVEDLLRENNSLREKNQYLEWRCEILEDTVRRHSKHLKQIAISRR
jgi:hypothetical protein